MRLIVADNPDRSTNAIIARFDAPGTNIAIQFPRAVVDDNPAIFSGEGSRVERVRAALERELRAGGAAGLLASAAWRLGVALP